MVEFGVFAVDWSDVGCGVCFGGFLSWTKAPIPALTQAVAYSTPQNSVIRESPVPTRLFLSSFFSALTAFPFQVSIIFMVIEFLAFTWYCLSYIPFGRSAVLNLVKLGG